MIEHAIRNSGELDGLDIEIFIQGSYANGTNVKVDSDVDVCVMLKSVFYANYPKGLENKDYGFSIGTIDYFDYNYKRKIIKILQNKFGSGSIKIGNKAVNIKSNTYRLDADVVIAFQYRDYGIINSKQYYDYVEGIKFFSNSAEIINYPKMHIIKGKKQNTSRNYNF